MKEKIIAAIKEFDYLDKETSLEFEEDNPDFLRRISECKNETELNRLIVEMYLVYSSVHLEFAESIIDSFSNRRADTKEYTNTLMDLGQKFNKIKNSEKDNLKKRESCKDLFNEVWNFYIKLQKNEKNIINQSKKEMWERYPIWFAIFVGLYVNFLGWLFASDKLIFNIKTVLFVSAGLIFISLGVWYFIEGFMYGGIRRIFKKG